MIFLSILDGSTISMIAMLKACSGDEFHERDLRLPPGLSGDAIQVLNALRNKGKPPKWAIEIAADAFDSACVSIERTKLAVQTRMVEINRRDEEVSSATPPRRRTRPRTAAAARRS